VKAFPRLPIEPFLFAPGPDYPGGVTTPREPSGNPFGMPPRWLRGWKGESLRRRGPKEFRIVTRTPTGIRVSIPLGPVRDDAKS
jgi:hypothetical protein